MSLVLKVRLNQILILHEMLDVLVATICEQLVKTGGAFRVELIFTHTHLLLHIAVLLCVLAIPDLRHAL